MSRSYLPAHAEWPKRRLLRALTVVVLLATTLVAAPLAGGAAAQDAEDLKITIPDPISLTKTLDPAYHAPDAEFVVGDEIHYTITAQNQWYLIPMLGVSVEDTTTGASTGCKYLNPMTRNAPGGTCVLESSHKVTQGDVDAGYFTNEARSCVTPLRRALFCTQTSYTVKFAQYPSVSVTKTAKVFDHNKNGYNDPGDVILWTATVVNDGNVTLSPAGLVDEDINCKLQEKVLAPGDSLSCEGKQLIKHSDVGTTIKNTALGGGFFGDQRYQEEAMASVEVPYLARITIKKSAVDEGGAFYFGGDLGKFGLKVKADSYNSRTFTVLAGQQYNVGERVPEGWNLTGLDCWNDKPRPTTVSTDTEKLRPHGSKWKIDAENARVAIYPAPYGSVTCNFTNTPKPTGEVVIKKITVGGEGKFGFDADFGRFALAGYEGKYTYSDTYEVYAGETVRVRERASKNWELTDINCFDDDGNSKWETSLEAAGARIAVGEDDRVTCVFTNTYVGKPDPTPKTGTVVIKKRANGDSGTFTFAGPNGKFNIYAGQGKDASVSYELTAGTEYKFSEYSHDGWTLASLSCWGDGKWSTVAATAYITPAAGGSTTCYWVNEAKVVKPTVEPADEVVVDKEEDKEEVVVKPVVEEEKEEVVPEKEEQETPVKPTPTPEPVKYGTITIEMYNHAGADTFGFGGDLGGFSLNGYQGAYVGKTFSVKAGTYGVTQYVNDGWNLWSVECYGTGSWSETNPSATITVGEGQHATCKWINKALPKEEEPKPKAEVSEDDKEKKSTKEEDIQNTPKVVDVEGDDLDA